MDEILIDYIDYSEEVLDGLSSKNKIISLESSVITHGLPYPQNINTFISIQNIIRKHGLVPAAIGIYEGKIKAGFSDSEIEILATHKNAHKINSGEIAWALSNDLFAGTTISATTYLSNLLGMDYFMAGGFGGAHFGDRFDISADMMEFAKNPIMVFCSGPKAILNIFDTMELLETLSVPVIGYQTNKLPGFIIRDTGIKIKNVAADDKSLIKQYELHKKLGRLSAFIVVIPPPSENSIDEKDFYFALKEANIESQKKKIYGAKLTPFLLEFINEKFSGKLFSTIESLLINNTKIASQIVKQIK